MRYEDRSRPALIKELKEGMEASLDLTVVNTHGYSVKGPRGYGRPQLFIFEVFGIDASKSGKDVIVWWFVSGRRAYDIVNYYKKRLVPGTRFITFGRWEWEARRSRYKLRLNKPADELEVLATPELLDQPADDPGTSRREHPRSSAGCDSRRQTRAGLSQSSATSTRNAFARSSTPFSL